MGSNCQDHFPDLPSAPEPRLGGPPIPHPVLGSCLNSLDHCCLWASFHAVSYLPQMTFDGCRVESNRRLSQALFLAPSLPWFSSLLLLPSSLFTGLSTPSPHLSTPCPANCTHLLHTLLPSPSSLQSSSTQHLQTCPWHLNSALDHQAGEVTQCKQCARCLAHDRC